MAEGAAGKLQIEIRAKLKNLERDLATVKQKLQQTGQEAEQSFSKGFKGALGSLTKIVGILGLIGAGLKGLKIQTQAWQGMFALAKGDTKDLAKHMEKMADGIRDLPIIGGVLDGMAQDIYDIVDAWAGITENLEKQEKALKKLNMELQAGRAGRASMKRSAILEQELKLMRDETIQGRTQIEQEMLLAKLAAEKKAIIGKTLTLEQRQTELGKHAIAALEKEMELVKEIALQEQEDKAIARQEAYGKLLKTSGQRLDLIRAQISAAEEEDEIAKILLTLETQRVQLKQEIAARQLEILNNEELTERERKALLSNLRKEFDLRADLQNLQARQLREAEEERREQERKTEELRKQKEEQKKQLEQMKEQQKALQEAQKADEERSRAIKSRLGGGTGVSSPKSGMTETASTAMGSFTFGEAGAAQSIKQLTKESKDLQQSMDQRLQSIDNLVRAMNQSMGFS